jgi:hypothetical protein
MELQATVNYSPPLGTTRFSFPGDFSYDIPPEATHLDVVMLGGGGGGGAGSVVTGTGGSAAAWATVTLERGVALPMTVTKINGTVGDGGAGGNYQGINPLPGTDGETSAILIGTGQPVKSVGGIGSGHTGKVSGDDVNQPNFDYNGYTYSGGGTQGEPGASGHSPGAGGAGGWPLSRGGKGARGQVWIRAYRVEP